MIKPLIFALLLSLPIISCKTAEDLSNRQSLRVESDSNEVAEKWFVMMSKDHQGSIPTLIEVSRLKFGYTLIFSDGTDHVYTTGKQLSAELVMKRYNLLAAGS